MFTEFCLGESTPKYQVLPCGESVGRVIVPVTNTGREAARFRITGTDRGGVCRFEFSLPNDPVRLAGQADFSLSPGGTALVNVRILPPRHPIFRLEPQIHFCTLSLRRLAPPQPERAVLVRIGMAPVIGPWLGGVLLILLALGLGIGIRQMSHRPLIALDGPITGGSSIDGSRGLLLAPISRNPVDQPPVDPLDPSAMTAVTYEDIFKEAGQTYNLEWQLLAEQAYWESRFNPYARGRQGEMGLMQIAPATWQVWGPKVGVSDPYDPYSNVLVAAAFLDYLRGHFAGLGYPEKYWMFIAYNWGPHNLEQMLANGDDWAAIPTLTRRYSLDIVRAVDSGSIRPAVQSALAREVEMPAQAHE